MADPRFRWLPGTVDVFVAYASPDRAQARALVAALRAQGLSPFIDEDLLPGDDWTLLLPEALRRARVVAVLVSERYNGAHYLRDEVVVAIRRLRAEPADRVVVPVLLGTPADLDGADPYGLSVFNYQVWSELGADGIAANLARVVRRLSAPAP